MVNVIKMLMIGFVQLTDSQKISKEGETCGGMLREPINVQMV